MRKEYFSPDVIVNDSISEGVYAASGVTSGDCWSIKTTPGQHDVNGTYTFEVSIDHPDTVEHISSKQVIVLIFNKNINNVSSTSGLACTVSGFTVTLTRELHANAYKAGDNATFNITVNGDFDNNELAITSSSVTCTHQTNVQGKFD